jgi:hypothetical protein
MIDSDSAYLSVRLFAGLFLQLLLQQASYQSLLPATTAVLMHAP